MPEVQVPEIVTLTLCAAEVPSCGTFVSDPPEQLIVLPLAIVSLVAGIVSAPEVSVSVVFTVNEEGAVKVTFEAVPCRVSWFTVMVKPVISTEGFSLPVDESKMAISVVVGTAPLPPPGVPVPEVVLQLVAVFQFPLAPPTQ